MACDVFAWETVGSAKLSFIVMYTEGDQPFWTISRYLVFRCLAPRDLVFPIAA